MTEGRFESTYNLRPSNWDNRKFWASGTSYKDDPPVGMATTLSATGNTHGRKPYGCDHDHRQRESCPFHDLRAQGCFQYEMGLHEQYNGPVEPSRLTTRRAGSAFRTVGAGENRTSRRGVGGGLMPCDTDIAVGAGPARAGGPWTKTGKKGILQNGLFSSFEHLPGDFTLRPTNVFANEKGGLVAPFRSGTKAPRTIGKGFPHMPDIYPAAARDPKHWRLGTGKARPVHRFPHAPEGGAPGGDEAGKARRREIAAKNQSARVLPFNAEKPLGGTFNKFTPQLPDPVPNKQIREYRPPIFTYHAHEKRQNPIIVPLTVGVQTADMDIRNDKVGSVELKKQNTSRSMVRSLPVMAS